MQTEEVQVPIRLLGRLTAKQTAAVLGFEPHDIPFLIRGKLLKPLGNPALNAPKFFCAREIVEYANDPAWLDKATRIVSRNWKERNERRRVNLAEESIASE